MVKIALQLKSVEKRGIYNVSSSSRLSKFDFGLLVAKKFNLDFNLIEKKSYDKSLNIKRPLDMSLDNKKLFKTGLVNPITIQGSIGMLYEEQDILMELESIVCEV